MSCIAFCPSPWKQAICSILLNIRTSLSVWPFDIGWVMFLYVVGIPLALPMLNGGPPLLSNLLGVSYVVKMCFSLSFFAWKLVESTGSAAGCSDHLGMVHCDRWIRHPMVNMECLLTWWELMKTNETLLVGEWRINCSRQVNHGNPRKIANLLKISSILSGNLKASLKTCVIFNHASMPFEF